jgi:16S rRNA (guanine527-N7)-methyltransferase
MAHTVGVASGVPELEAGAAALGVQLTSRQVDQLLDYLELMRKWNQVYNLTAVREPHAMLTHHLLDSLAVVQPLRRHTWNTGSPFA